jgi:hypothetical protein
MRFLLVLVFISFQIFAAADPDLRKELESMAKEDQDIREKVGQLGWENTSEDLVTQMKLIDKNNTQRLKQIIEEFSWVTVDLVGESGVSSAFLIIQHSPDKQFQERMLPVLKKSYLDGDGISGQEFALLTDRVLVHQGKEQLYGTQLDISDNKLSFDPIFDEQNVDQRRVELGMPSLKEYKKIIEEVYGMKVK